MKPYWQSSTSAMAQRGKYKILIILLCFGDLLEPIVWICWYQKKKKFPYFADTTERADRGERRSKDRVTLWITLVLMNSYDQPF